MGERVKIITTHIYPPIPFRGCDWEAHLDGDEPTDDGQWSGPRGFGATESEAIANLKDEMESPCEHCGQIGECDSPTCDECGERHCGPCSEVSS